MGSDSKSPEYKISNEKLANKFNRIAIAITNLNEYIGQLKGDVNYIEVLEVDKNKGFQSGISPKKK